ncbi:hypothetical protein M885DRAFT_295165 [Pelagophyceae sp. CCMP2097]|nr:hypothetical protein M885DRAFT_295165 [Pelagophyceae sp. CCMP2097]
MRPLYRKPSRDPLRSFTDDPRRSLWRCHAARTVRRGPQRPLDAAPREAAAARHRRGFESAPRYRRHAARLRTVAVKLARSFEAFRSRAASMQLECRKNGSASCRQSDTDIVAVFVKATKVRFMPNIHKWIHEALRCARASRPSSRTFATSSCPTAILWNTSSLL